MTEIERIAAIAAAAGVTLTPAQAATVAAALGGLPAARRHGATLAFEAEPSGFLAAQRESPPRSSPASRGRETVKNFGHMNRRELVDFVHTLPEWKDPDGTYFQSSTRTF